MTAKKIVVPPAYASKLPTSKAIAALKGAAPVILPAGNSLYRAAWNADSILPLVANKFYRFGPPSGALSRNRRPPYWYAFLAAIQGAEVPADFLSSKERAHGMHERDPLAGWTE